MTSVTKKWLNRCLYKIASFLCHHFKGNRMLFPFSRNCTMFMTCRTYAKTATKSAQKTTSSCFKNSIETVCPVSSQINERGSSELLRVRSQKWQGDEALVGIPWSSQWGYRMHTYSVHHLAATVQCTVRPAVVCSWRRIFKTHVPTLSQRPSTVCIGGNEASLSLERIDLDFYERTSNLENADWCDTIIHSWWLILVFTVCSSSPQTCAFMASSQHVTRNKLKKSHPKMYPQFEKVYFLQLQVGNLQRHQSPP